jgi:hypothetical protein
MNTLDNNPYHGIAPEERRLIVLRAHAERAKAIRRAFAGLLWWRRTFAAHRHIAAERALKAAHEH